MTTSETCCALLDEDRSVQIEDTTPVPVMPDLTQVMYDGMDDMAGLGND